MKITFVNGDDAGSTFEFFLPQITVGREDANDLRLPTSGVSRYHALFEQVPTGGWTIRDQGSTNGVKVNGERISGVYHLSENDLVIIGEQHLRVFDLSGAPPQIVFNPVNAETLSVQAGPAPGTAVSLDLEKNEPVPEKNSSMVDEDLLESLKGGSLFSEKQQREESTPPEVNSDKNSGRRPMSQGVFYTIIVCMAVIVISAAANIFSSSGKKSGESVPQEDKPIYLLFEKLIVQQDNVFRFSLKVEGSRAVFTIDDIKSCRHPEALVVENPVGLDVLRGRITASGIWKAAAPQTAPDGSGLRRRLSVMIGSQVKEMVISGHRAPVEFEEVEEAVNNFAEGCGMQTVTLSGDEVRRIAQESFDKANDLYANRESSGGNLREAIARYRVAVNYLNQFSPPPPILKKARAALKEAEDLRRKKLEELDFNRVKFQNVRDFDALRRVFMEVMEMTEPESKEYNTARRRLHIIDSRLKKSRGSR